MTGFSLSNWANVGAALRSFWYADSPAYRLKALTALTDDDADEQEWESAVEDVEWLPSGHALHLLRERADARFLQHALPDQAVDEESVADWQQQRIHHALADMLSDDSMTDALLSLCPRLMPQLLSALRNPSISAGRLAEMVKQEPTLVGDILRLANSGYYRTSSRPVESLQRALVVCGTEGLQSLAATALMRPVFESRAGLFGHFPALLWERAARSARVMSMYAKVTGRCDPASAQMLAFLSALGPLLVFHAVMKQYELTPELKPSARVVRDLVSRYGRGLSRKLAECWQTPAALIAALSGPMERRQHAAATGLADALACGELFGTLSLLLERRAMTKTECQEWLAQVEWPDSALKPVWHQLGVAA